jgi:glycosyltransferase involved in cell wall biosynthesis
MNLSIIIPAHNEENSIEEVIKAIEQNVSVEHEIVVVNDHSSDKTTDIVERLAAQYRNNLSLVSNHNEPGFANALKSGFMQAKSDILVPVMADLCDDPDTINTMYKKILEGFDIVSGSRYIKGGKRLGGSRLKAFFSFFVGMISHLFFGVPTHDITNSFKMCRKNVISSITINAVSFEISMEITLKAYLKGFKITEIPTIWQDRTAGESKFNSFKVGPKYFKLFLWGFFTYLKKGFKCKS